MSYGVWSAHALAWTISSLEVPTLSLSKSVLFQINKTYILAVLAWKLYYTKYIKSNLYSQIFSNVKTVMVEQPAIILQRLIWYLLVFDICISE